MDPQERACSKCKQIKPLNEYFKKGERLRSECKVCTAQYSKAYKSRPDVASRIQLQERGRSIKRRAYLWAYRAENKDRLKKKAREWYAKNRPVKPVYTLTCHVTGNLFISSRSNAKYSAEGRRLRQRERYHLKTIETHGQNKLLLSCAHCQREFTPDHGDKHRVYCSDICRVSAQKQREKALSKYRSKAKKYGAAFEPVTANDIMERAGFVCEICGKSTPANKRGSYDNDAPEINHKIPLSQGGGHVSANIRCVCRECNINLMRKGPFK